MTLWILQQLGLVTLGTSSAIALWMLLRVCSRRCATSAYRISVIALLAILGLVPVQIGAAMWNASRPAEVFTAPIQQLLVTPQLAASRLPTPVPAPAISPPNDRLPAATPNPAQPFPLSIALLTLYSSGMALVLLLGAIRCGLAARLVSRASPVTDPFVLRIWMDVQRRMQCPTGLRLLESPSLDVPACFGPVRPCVLLPASDQRLRDPGRLALVLRHEATHLSRRDPLISLGAALLLAAQWFNPLVWAFTRQLHEDKESSCDAAVVVATGNARAYALTLLDFGHSLRRTRSAAVFAGLGGNRLHGTLNRRLHMIEAMSISTKGPSSHLILAACLTLGGGLPALHAAAAARHPAPPISGVVAAESESGIVKRAVIEAPPGDRAKPPVTPFQITPLKFGDLRDRPSAERATIASAKNATLTDDSIEADEVTLTLPWGSGLVANVDGAEVRWEKTGEATLIRALDGVLKITDNAGVDRVVVRAVGKPPEAQPAEPFMKVGAATLRTVAYTPANAKQDPIGLQATVVMKPTEIVIRLHTLGETSGRVRADVNRAIPLPAPDAKPELPQVRYNLISPLAEGPTHVWFNMYWVYTGEVIDGC